MIDQLTQEDFTPHLESEFRVSVEGHDEPIPMRLVEVSAVGSTKLERPPFSIVFLAPPEVHLPQMIYEIEHETMEAMGLFLVPLGPVKDGFQYEAVFT